MRQVMNTEPVPIKFWLDDIEEGALQQARNLARLPFVHKWVAIMPDSHQGFGMPIGGVLATKDVIIPNAVGVDIGCGIAAVQTSIEGIDTDTLKAIMGRVREAVPVGFNHHREAQHWDGFDQAPDLPIIQQELASARRQLGTLGGGNHFIEFQADEVGRLWVMLHSGSRNFGLKVAKVYHQQAQALCERWHVQLPDKDLAYLPMGDQAGQDYFAAMTYCLEFAQANRDHMMNAVLEAVGDLVGGQLISWINIHHNYAALENHHGENVWVHRKGATRARAGEVGIIPGSMGSSSYIVEGLGNPESFQSCSHGAGRKLGRRQAERTLNLDEEQAKMDALGIVHGLRGKGGLDEAPGAYKDIDTVMANQADLVKIITRLRPLGSIKG
ncbi:MAG TPA: RtcB family protein [Holophaga sp.]|nr:RtcB family protein [Holophaga sp.]